MAFDPENGEGFRFSKKSPGALSLVTRESGLSKDEVVAAAISFGDWHL